MVKLLVGQFYIRKWFSFVLENSYITGGSILNLWTLL